jgi:hypothetical protein
VWHIARIGEESNAYKFVVEKHGGMNLFEGLGIEGDNVKINLKVIVFNSSGWIHLAQDRGHCWALMKNAGNILSS